jgi:ketosteroid isomerase-like protein
MTKPLTGIIAAHVAAINAFDTEAIAATFASDAFVNDNRRELWGADAITKWIAKELVGARVTMEITEVIEHGAMTVVRAKYDGNYDKSKLPPVLILTSYFTVADGKIQSLVIIHNA